MAKLKSQDIGEKANMMAYMLGRAMINNLRVATHEFSLSTDPMHRKLYKAKIKEITKFQQDFHKLFIGYNKFLSEKELAKFDEGIEKLSFEIWD